MNPEKGTLVVNAEATARIPRWGRWVQAGVCAGLSLTALAASADRVITEVERIVDGEVGETTHSAAFVPNPGYGPDVVNSSLGIIFLAGGIRAGKAAVGFANKARNNR